MVPGEQCMMLLIHIKRFWLGLFPLVDGIDCSFEDNVSTIYATDPGSEADCDVCPMHEIIVRASNPRIVYQTAYQNSVFVTTAFSTLIPTCVPLRKCSDSFNVIKVA